MRLATATILSASALALALGTVLPAAAQEGGEGQELIDIRNWAYGDIYQGWRAEQLLNGDVIDQDGEDIGEVEDLIINTDGRIERVIIEAGGFLDIGDTHFAMAWDEVTMMDPDTITVPFDEDNIEDYSIFGDVDSEPTGPRQWRVRELLGDYAQFSEGPRFGLIEDVIFDTAGNIQAIVIGADVGYGVGGPYAVPFTGYGYGYDPAYDYYEVPYAVEDIEALGPFNYEMMRGEM